MNLPGGWELVLILLVVMVLFGSKRLPDAARSLGRSMRILKAETKGLRDDDGDGYDDRSGKPMPLARTERSDVVDADRTDRTEPGERAAERSETR